MEKETILDQTKLNFQDFVKLLLYYRVILYTIVGLTTVFLIIFLLVVHPKFTAEALILPSTSTPPTFSMFQGLLGGLDIDRFTEGEYISSYFFPDVLKSRPIIEKLLNTRFEFYLDGSRVDQTLLEYYNKDVLAEATNLVDNDLEVDTDFETGIINISYENRSPQLASKVVNKLIEYLNWFNNYNLKTKAQENLEYIETRLNIVKVELEEAEQSVKEFKEKNRNYSISSSPELQLTLERLERNKDVKSDIYKTLMNQRELERLKVKKEVPIVNVLSYATPPYFKSYPNRKLIVIIGFTVSFMFSVLVIFFLFLIGNSDKFKKIDIKASSSYFYSDLKKLNFIKKRK